jgi:hypothetical protein
VYERRLISGASIQGYLSIPFAQEDESPSVGLLQVEAA